MNPKLINITLNYTVILLMLILQILQGKTILELEETRITTTLIEILFLK